VGIPGLTGIQVSFSLDDVTYTAPVLYNSAPEGYPNPSGKFHHTATETIGYSAADFRYVNIEWQPFDEVTRPDGSDVLTGMLTMGEVTFDAIGDGNGNGPVNWITTNSGNWHVAENWTGGQVPGGTDQIVWFQGGSSEQTVFTNTAVTVRDIRLNNVHTYAIAGTGSVNLDSDADMPTVEVLQGSHQFQAIVNLVDPTTVNVATGARLTFNNALNLNGNTLTKTGAGTLAINNALTSAGGTLNCDEGVCSGSGTIGGDVNNNGTVSPGNSPGVMEMAGNFTQHEDGTLLIELAGTTSGTEHDVFSVGGIARLQGRLEISLLDGFQPQVGDSFDILNLAVLNGEFDDISLPELADGLIWDTLSLYGDGVLAVVPELSTLVLMAIATLVLMQPRGRNRWPSR